MAIKSIIQSQYQDIVERARVLAEGSFVPKEGWIRTIRKALNMSGVQLASRSNVSKASISHTEKAELEGGVTIKKMEQMAQALNCRFVYFMVPEKPIKDVLSDQAKMKAEAVVAQASGHMALEAQALSSEQLNFEVERLKQELLSEMPSDLWDNKS